MADKLSLLLSGPGLIGHKHAALIQDNSDTVLSAVVAPDTNKNAEFAESYGVRLYTSIEQALTREAVDAAIISSPNAFHSDQAMACLNHGVPALVEKPLTDCLSQAAHLANASESLGVACLVGHHRTYSPLLQMARSFIMSKEFGNLVCLQGSALFYKPDDYFAAGPWRTKKGGGPILINLIHEIGVMRFLCGEITSVSTVVSNSARDFEVEDSAAIVMAFANGAIGTFILSDATASSKSWEMTAGENPAYPHFPDQNCYHFAGDMGSLDFPSMRKRSYLEPADRTWLGPFKEDILPYEPHDPLERQLAHFVDVVHNGAKPLVSARDGLDNMLVLSAIEAAADRKCTVQIAEIAAQSGIAPPEADP